MDPEFSCVFHILGGHHGDPNLVHVVVDVLKTHKDVLPRCLASLNKYIIFFAGGVGILHGPPRINTLAYWSSKQIRCEYWYLHMTRYMAFGMQTDYYYHYGLEV